MKSQYSIYNLRKEFGKTADEFAKYLGVSQATISNWEAGKGKPSFNYMRKLEALQNQGHDLDVVVNWKLLCEQCQKCGKGDFRLYALRHGIEPSIVIAWEKGHATTYDVPAFMYDELCLAYNNVYVFAVDYDNSYVNPYRAEMINTIIRVSEMSQSRLAKKLGVTQSAIWHWRAGKNYPNEERLELLDAFIDSNKNLRERVYSAFYKKQSKTAIYEHPAEGLDKPAVKEEQNEHPAEGLDKPADQTKPVAKEVQNKPAEVAEKKQTKSLGKYLVCSVVDHGDKKCITTSGRGGLVSIELSNEEYSRFSKLLQENAKTAILNTIKEFI